MNKVRKISIILIIPFIIFSMQKVYSFYQTNYIIPNKFKAATYNVVLEEEFYDEFGTKKVWIANNETGNANVVLRINYDESFSKTVDNERLTLSNIVNNQNVVDKVWTDDFLNDFEKGNDGWYYYKKILKPTEKVQILESISLNENLILTSPYYQEYKSYDYNLSFNFESIQATKNAVKEIWDKDITINNDNVDWEEGI